MSSVESNPQPEVQKLAEKRVRFVRLPELAMLNHKDTASAAKGPGGGHGGEASAGASERGVEANREPEGAGMGAVAETGESSTAAAKRGAGTA